MAQHSAAYNMTHPHSPVRIVALVAGVVFLAVGILGFIPGVTTHYSQMTFATDSSGAMLFGLFQVSILHNLVHLAYGVLGVIASSTARAAQTFLVVGGVIYLALWVYGLVITQGSAADFVPLNTADNWLHFALGIGMVGLGVLVPRATLASAAR